MNRTTKIIVIALAIIVVVAIIAAVILMGGKQKSNLGEIKSGEDLSAIIDKVYEGQEDVVPGSVQTQVVDVTNNDLVKMYTGLDNGSDMEYLVASEPMITSQAYSFVLVKVKDGVNANEMAEKIKDNVDSRKWICVSAEKVYTTSSGNVVCLVMSAEEAAKPIYEKFKSIAGNVGQEYEKTEEEVELPPEMY